MYNLQLVEDRIMSIANKLGLSKNKLLLNTKLNKSVFDNMKKGQIPSVDKIHAIADYLDCSVDYLLGRTDVVEVNRRDFVYTGYGEVAALGGIENPQPPKKRRETT